MDSPALTIAQGWEWTGPFVKSRLRLEASSLQPDPPRFVGFIHRSSSFPAATADYCSTARGLRNGQKEAENRQVRSGAREENSGALGYSGSPSVSKVKELR